MKTKPKGERDKEGKRGEKGRGVGQKKLWIPSSQRFTVTLIQNKIICSIGLLKTSNRAEKGACL